MRVKINRFPGVGGCDGGLRGLEPRTIFVHLEPCDREESCEREALEPPPALAGLAAARSYAELFIRAGRRWRGRSQSLGA
jgi:hypothetical protein